jgi:hypothetical protein
MAGFTSFQAGIGGSGQQSTSPAVHLRVVRSAAIGFSPLPVVLATYPIRPLNQAFKSTFTCLS